MVMPRWRSLPMRCLTPAISLNIRCKPRAEIRVTVQYSKSVQLMVKRKRKKQVSFLFWLAGWLAGFCFCSWRSLVSCITFLFFPMLRTSGTVPVIPYLSSVRYASVSLLSVKIIMLIVLMETCENEWGRKGKIRRTEFAAFFSLPCSLTRLLVFIIIMVSYREAWEEGRGTSDKNGEKHQDEGNKRL